MNQMETRSVPPLLLAAPSEPSIALFNATSKKAKQHYIPDMSHPWKKDNFMKYVHAMVGHETDWAC